MGLYNLGSIAKDVLILIPDTPTALSGASLELIANRQVQFAEQVTGQTIGSVDIAEKYQPALVDLTACDVLRSAEAVSSPTDEGTLGDFRFKTTTSSGSTSSKIFCESGMLKLNMIGRKPRFVRVIGGN